MTLGFKYSGFKILTGIKESGDMFENSFKQSELDGNLNINYKKFKGKLLAHFLIRNNLFPNCNISLLGFSLGNI